MPNLASASLLCHPLMEFALTEMKCALYMGLSLLFHLDRNKNKALLLTVFQPLYQYFQHSYNEGWVK